MKKQINKYVKIVFLLAIASTIFSCTSMPEKTNAKKEFEHYTLDNGIPVILNKTDSSKVVTLEIAVLGGVTVVEPEFSGIEESLFNMMTMGSESYTYDYIKQEQYSKLSALTANVYRNGSSVGLTTIDYYFDELFPMLVDGFLNPSFGEQEYQTVMTVIMQGLQQSAQDPMTLLNETISKTLYKDHPYQTFSTATMESVQNITIENMKNHLANMHNAKRIAIIAVGNFDGEELVAKLNPTLGQLSGDDFSMPSIPAISPNGEPIVQGISAAQGSGFITCAMPAPMTGSDEEMANTLVANMFSEILFNVVRENHGSVYSIAAQYANSNAPFNLILGYMVSDPQNIVAHIEEAKQIMASGKLISGRDPITGEFIYTSIDERLESYKNKLLNANFYEAQTNNGIASNMVSSLFKYNDAAEYTDFTRKVREVEAEDIQNVFNTYWMSNESQWFAITGTGEEDLFNF